MPQEAWSDKRERQYEHVRDSLEDRGTPKGKAKEIAARTVNKERARTGRGAGVVAPLARGHLLGPPRRPAVGNAARKGRTRDQLYEEAKNLRVEGRSKMTKAQLQRAVDAKKS